MKKITLALALCSTALAAPALARDNAWYLGVDAGAWFPEDSHATIRGTADTTIKKKTGYDADVNFGYDFGAFRLEAEYAHKKANNKLTSDSNGFVPAQQYGMVRVDSGMLNGLVEFGPDDGLQGFVGGGVGYGWAKDVLPGSHSGDNGFAWQGIAGVRLPLSESVDVSLKYRYYRQDHIDILSDAGRPARVNIKAHSALLGIAFNFGGHSEPPPPPPPAAAPSASAASPRLRRRLPRLRLRRL